MQGLTTKIFICILLCVGLGLLSGINTMGEVNNWFTTVAKPRWNPPNWLFGPVWTTLYILMGIAAALIWHSKHYLKRRGLALFVIQFILNLAWSYIFFTRHLIGVAFAEIIVMLFFIILTTVVFFKINRTAGWLMVPYIAWVSFATVLNGTIANLNA